MRIQDEKPETVDECKEGRDLADDVSFVAETEEGTPQSNGGSRTRRRKSLPFKLRMEVSVFKSCFMLCIFIAIHGLLDKRLIAYLHATYSVYEIPFRFSVWVLMHACRLLFDFEILSPFPAKC